MLLVENLTRRLEQMPYDYLPSLHEVIEDESITRLQSVLEGRTGFDLPTGTSKLVLHMFPESAFVDPKEYDIRPLPPLSAKEWISETDCYSMTSYIKIPHTSTILSYTQFFQDGYIEAVDSSDLTQERLIQAVNQYMEAYRTLGIDLPVHIRFYHIDAYNRAYKMPVIIACGNENLRELLESLFASNSKVPLE
jgi:hypothetical protein